MPKVKKETVKEEEIKQVEQAAETVVAPVVEKTAKKAKKSTKTEKPTEEVSETSESIEAINEDSGKEKAPKLEKPKSGYYFGNGRRKTATARARLYLPNQEVTVAGKKAERGETFVNNLPIDTYFNDPFSRSAYTEVFRTTNTIGRFITTITVVGSGKSGQLGAVTLAISRALCTVDPRFRAILRKRGYMTRDPRMKERKKPGLMGARKQKSSPKR